MIELADFTDLFSRQVVERKLRKKDEDENAGKTPKVTYAKILDSKRSQNVGILVKSLNLDIETVRHAVIEFDTSAVDLETIQKVYDSVSSRISHLSQVTNSRLLRFLKHI